MSEQQGFGLIQTAYGTLFTGSTTGITSSINVAEYNNTVLQFITLRSGSANATASVNVYSSLDNASWISSTTLGPYTSNSASALTTISGRKAYIQAILATTGNITSSLYYLCGQ
jgi:hypothetical protein